MVNFKWRVRERERERESGGRWIKYILNKLFYFILYLNKISISLTLTPSSIRNIRSIG